MANNGCKPQLDDTAFFLKEQEQKSQNELTSSVEQEVLTSRNRNTSVKIFQKTREETYWRVEIFRRSRCTNIKYLKQQSHRSSDKQRTEKKEQSWMFLQDKGHQHPIL